MKNHSIGTSAADTIEDPSLSAYNVLNCRPGTSFSYSTGGSLQNGLIIAMNIKPYSGQTSVQTLFAMRNSANNWVSLKAQFDPSTGKVIINTQSTSSVWSQVMTSSSSLTTGENYRKPKS